MTMILLTELLGTTSDKQGCLFCPKVVNHMIITWSSHKHYVPIKG